jgi:hypothetical protein
MFNTTTIPSQNNNNVSGGFVNVCCILSTSAIVGLFMMEFFLYKLREKNRQSDTNESSDEEEDETETYCHKYEDEFKALSTRTISTDELLQLNTKYVREEVAPKVEVVMTFDKATETFWYYTDQLKEVSYDILETVAQKFVIEHDCKAIYLQTETEASETAKASEAAQASETAQASEAAQSSEAVVSEAAQASEAVASETAAESAKPSIFAKFKDYNTGGKGSTPNFTSVLQVIEQMNHFRYRGKICDYEATLKSEENKKNNTVEPQLDYVTYKKLLEKKED